MCVCICTDTRISLILTCFRSHGRHLAQSMDCQVHQRGWHQVSNRTFKCGLGDLCHHKSAGELPAQASCPPRRPHLTLGHGHVCLSPHEPQSWISVPLRAVPWAPHAQTPVRGCGGDCVQPQAPAGDAAVGNRAPAECTWKCPISHFPQNPLFK